MGATWTNKINFLLRMTEDLWYTNRDSLAAWLESKLICAVFNRSYFTVSVNISVLSFDFSVGGFSFNFEASISSLIAVGVAAILIVLVDLLQNSDWFGFWRLGRLSLKITCGLLLSHWWLIVFVVLCNTSCRHGGDDELEDKINSFLNSLQKLHHRKMQKLFVMNSNFDGKRFWY